MDYDATRLATQHLHANEKMLWAGRPARGIRFSSQDYLMIPFSLMWGGFAFFWEYSVFHSNAPVFFRLWGVPFVLVGLYIIAGRFLWDAWQRAGEVYAVTNKRLLIVGRRSVSSSALSALPQLTLETGVDGEGTINFSSPKNMGRGGISSAARRGESFAFLRSANQVFDLILEARKTA